MAIEDYVGKDIPTHQPFQRYNRPRNQYRQLKTYKDQFLNSKGEEETYDDSYIWEAQTSSSTKKTLNSDKNEDKVSVDERQVEIFAQPESEFGESNRSNEIVQQKEERRQSNIGSPNKVPSLTEKELRELARLSINYSPP